MDLMSMKEWVNVAHSFLDKVKNIYLGTCKISSECYNND